MTADRCAVLVEKVASLYWDKYKISDAWIATAATDLIRAEVLEEAVQAAKECGGSHPHCAEAIAAAILALKSSGP